jgi:hypothetical protein
VDRLSRKPLLGGVRCLDAVGYVLGGVGIASIIAGSVFGVRTLSAASKAKSDEDLCPDMKCTSKGDELIKSAKFESTVSTVTLGAGAALLVTGGLLVLTAKKGTKEVVRVSPEVGPTVAFIQMKGVFQ